VAGGTKELKMGRAAGYVYGQNYVKRYFLGATWAANAALGTPALTVAGNPGAGPATTTGAANALGLCVGDNAYAYSTVQATILAQGAPATVEVDINPGLIINMLLSGATTASTALTVLTNTVTSSGGVLITDAANVPANDMKGGFVWRYQNGVAGEGRVPTTHTGSTSFVPTTPFKEAIAIGDQFLFSPYYDVGDGAASSDGNSNITWTSDLRQADGSAATGAGADIVAVHFIPGNRYTTQFEFCLGDQIWFGSTTI